MIEIKVPSPGESISEVEIGTWLVDNGAHVERDQEVVSLESEKASLTATAPESGSIKILFPNGTRVGVGTVIAEIDTTVTGNLVKEPVKSAKISPETPKVIPVAPPVTPVTPAATPVAAREVSSIRMTPVAREIMQSHNLTIEDIIKGLRRITKEDVNQVIESGVQQPAGASESSKATISAERSDVRKRMSLLREKLSERLVAVKNETAMLTTFNEIDMTAVVDLRNRYKSVFEEKHKVKLGFMSFFTLAASRALVAFPQINSQLDGNEIVTFNYCDIGIAIQTPKGLMVPVLRNTQSMTLAEIESGISQMATKARENKMSIEDLQGGTFSITNGGTYGSLMSTPILNPPQPAILGMHNIVDRPVALNGQVVIRPMMYVALSYDHRLIDGKDSVGFLMKIKELIENPVKMFDPAGQAEQSLLSI
ncbi:MAG: 2-oxoglutarate dehydrogenase complex dihydrolipoyllysine-residue succinyltransferase [Bacteroidales bacterium]|jgi:2-oxoglutarate dehydrogenase E2 component (dihydrolipoamide succinyltransferase)